MVILLFSVLTSKDCMQVVYLAPTSVRTSRADLQNHVSVHLHMYLREVLQHSHGTVATEVRTII